MESSTILAIIFVIILVVAGVFHSVLKKPLMAKFTFGIGALVTTILSYILHDTTVPTWLLVVATIFILVDAWRSSKK